MIPLSLRQCHVKQEHRTGFQIESALLRTRRGVFVNIRSYYVLPAAVKTNRTTILFSNQVYSHHISVDLTTATEKQIQKHKFLFRIYTSSVSLTSGLFGQYKLYGNRGIQVHVRHCFHISSSKRGMDCLFYTLCSDIGSTLPPKKPWRSSHRCDSVFTNISPFKCLYMDSLVCPICYLQIRDSHENLRVIHTL